MLQLYEAKINSSSEETKLLISVWPCNSLRSWQRTWTKLHKIKQTENVHGIFGRICCLLMFWRIHFNSNKRVCLVCGIFDFQAVGRLPFSTHIASFTCQQQQHYHSTNKHIWTNIIFDSRRLSHLHFQMKIHWICFAWLDCSIFYDIARCDPRARKLVGFYDVCVAVML